MRGRFISLPGDAVAIWSDKPLTILLMVMAGIAFIVGVNIWLGFAALPYG